MKLKNLLNRGGGIGEYFKERVYAVFEFRKAIYFRKCEYDTDFRERKTYFGKHERRDY